ncbi:MAG: glycoside hydrolase family 99-like domain-containing protein [Prevotellaceae bacterium]|jgi:lipopolysaccharide biosynthesis protein|nr:glycoside hydrolase family 99-like domain-containing protein [Prevotellaceae bacterium]
MARFIAFYLPQYHPVPENDKWWGKGFTEWTNVAKAKPLFKGHKQPHIPADLGFYDLRMPEVREAQANLAREAGIEAFCYWHYWFGGKKQILERPFSEVLASGKPDFPFCLGWANESWTNKSWTNKSSFAKEGVLLSQEYGREDYIEHFNAILPALKDKRYLTVDGKPLFYVYRPLSIPNAKEFIDLWQKMAVENGLEGIYFVGMSFSTSFRPIGNIGHGGVKVPPIDEAAKYYRHILDLGFDAVNSRGNARAEFIISGRYNTFIRALLRKILKMDMLNKYDQSLINSYLFTEEDKWSNVFPTIIPNWDRSPRSGKNASVYVNSTPSVFAKSVRNAIDIVKNKSHEHQIVFIQSWNEWGEGNYMEPDLEYGIGYIEALKNEQIKHL